MRRIARSRSLFTVSIDHKMAKELDEIDHILGKHNALVAMVLSDISARGVSLDTGRPGMSAGQVLRCLLLKQMNGFSYEELEFHILDSSTYRKFCGFEAFDKTPKKSALQHNIKKISGKTLEQINHLVLRGAKDEGIEPGSKIRVDCTVVETNIHEPSDSKQLWDSVRVLARLMQRCRDSFGLKHPNHSRIAKNYAYGIQTAKKAPERKRLYLKLLDTTRATVKHARAAMDSLKKLMEMLDPIDSLLAEGIRKDLGHFADLAGVVIQQTHRRVVLEEKLRPEEKLFSIFEPHTDIIIKGRRKTEFGHKVCLATGKSGLVTDCVVLEGNPADSTLAQDMVKRHLVHYGRVPNKVAFDGGFASKENLASIKALGSKDVAFSKRRGLKVEDMTSSEAVYRRMFRFRAGIEAGISLLKRAFGWTRSTWKGLRSFGAYVWGSVLAHNLVALARIHLEQANL